MQIVMLGECPVDVRPGGMNRYFEALAKVLPDVGIEPECVLLDGLDLQQSLPKRLLVYLRKARDSFLGKDILDFHFALYAILPLVFTRRTGKIIVHFHGPWAGEAAASGSSASGQRLKFLLESAVYRRANHFVVLSLAFKEILVTQYGVAAERVSVIRPGVDLELFRPNSLVERTVEIPENDFLVVAARRLDRRMGIDVLISAWAQVLAERPQAMLLIAGEGIESQDLAERIAKLPEPSRARLLGRVSDEVLSELYRRAACSVVPSRALEGFGLVVLESLACGTPVIVSDIGGLPEILLPFDPTLVTPPENHDALARRLLAASQGALPDRHECREFAERHTWRETARQHAILYGKLVNPETPQIE